MKKKLICAVCLVLAAVSLLGTLRVSSPSLFESDVESLTYCELSVYGNIEMRCVGSEFQCLGFYKGYHIKCSGIYG